MEYVKDVFKKMGNSILNSVADVLESSDFISRTIGMNNSYEDIMFIVQALGREPVSLLGKDYPFIYDHVRRNYMQGSYLPNKEYDGCYKFTFYKEVPTVRFANPYEDSMNLKDRWIPSMKFHANGGNGTSIHYSESDDERTNNRQIDAHGDLQYGGYGTATNVINGYALDLTTCDLIKKTNDNFNHGKYETLIARFHTNKDSSKNTFDSTQTAISKKYGMSHGRNLLSKNTSDSLGYDNPYCRVWTYHHQYNQIKRQIRPFTDDNGNLLNQENLENNELVGNYKTVGFRTSDSKTYGIDGGSKRLDRHGVLNYKNGTVNIAPTAKIKDYFHHKENDYEKQIIATKKCMFSIENLAWRDDKSRKDEFDAYGLSPEQKGPLGGRIMWFPPYDLTFSEDISVDWNTHKFIGRGENIYTYTNTERRGNLSFTLLIDHPSILDYWTGHERNGMKNKGKTLSSGNDGGVDNQDNQENTLLRFFAGCDILSAKPQDYLKWKVTPNLTNEKKDDSKDTPTESDEASNGNRKKVMALLYFPNNYSGKDDRVGTVNPIYYIMNGAGCQTRYFSENGKSDDFEVDIHNDLSSNATGFKGGYEVRPNGSFGISSIVNYNENIGQIRNSFSGEAETIISIGGQSITVKYGNGTDYVLTKIIGNEALKKESLSEKNIENKDWYRRRYNYRCDNDNETENQYFSDPMSYIDSVSFGLNGVAYEDVRKDSFNAASLLKVEKSDSDSFKLISFTDLFVALEGDDVAPSIKEESIKDNVDLVRNILTKNSQYTNVKVTFNGHASYQGRESSNNTLARNRGETLKYWFDLKCSTNGIKMSDVGVLNQTDKPVIDDGHLSTELVKIWRSASITIEYDEKQIEDAATAELTSLDPNLTRTEIDSKEKSKELFDFYDVNNPTLDAESKLNSGLRSLEGQMKSKETFDFFGVNNPTLDAASMLENGLNSLSKRVNESIIEGNSTESTVKRYDNEGEFFQALTENDPTLHNLISQKIKYFDPAFHSISPEGFNARLTFLHQCTRQGSTVERSASESSTAYNLSFGRPPVCVLRLGDFYYTKIIFNSISIQFENAQWDMNPEGIGMMPTFAKINMSFTFLGGSDIAGPIARLQNAVSFNYYANASVYDNRAERVEYEPNGSGKEEAFKGYVYPRIYGTRNLIAKIPNAQDSVKSENENYKGEDY